MTEEPDAYSVGFQTGQSLLAPGPALRRVLAVEGERIQKAIAESERKNKTSNLRCKHLEERLGACAAKGVAVNNSHDAAERRRDANPARYSPVRGLFYFGAGLLVLVADAIFLTQVLASILQLDVGVLDNNDQPIGPIGALLAGEQQYIRPFYELYLASIGVVALTVAFKAWLDSKRPQNGEEPTSWRERWMTPSVAILFVVFAMFATIAYSRMVLDFGEFTSGDAEAKEFLARFAAMMIGAAAPAGGTLLFIIGLDFLGRWTHLHLTRWRAKRVEKEYQRALADFQQLTLAHEEGFASVPDSLALTEAAATRARAAEEFRRGFAEGLRSVVETRELGAYRRVRSRLLAASATSSPNRTHPRLLPSKNP